jgi:two-component system chemotaxis response regulator CheB
MTIGVFITDDSDLARELIRRVIGMTQDVVVVGSAASVEETMAHPGLARADVVILDLWLPGRSGLGVVRELAGQRSVIVVSDNPETSPLGREALAQGAAAVFCKTDLGKAEGRDRFLAAIRAASRRPGREHPVVAVVGSTGAMAGLERVVPALVGAEVSLIVLQHMPIGRERELAKWITSLGVPTRPARTSDALEIGRGIVATSAGHLVVTGPSRVAVKPGDPVDGHLPAASELLRSATRLGRRLVAVVLSGMGRDGAVAIPALLEAGAACIALAPEDCTAPSMPQAAIDASVRVSPVRLADLAVRVESAVRIAGRCA